MKTEIKNCQNCQKDFTIEIEDFTFYEKLKVPSPKLCRECRQMRRMSFRNERNLYKRKCDKTGKNIISIFPSDSPLKVYNYAYWYSDEFDPMDYAREFDFSRTFFEQFKELMLKMPWPSLQVRNSENCEYNNDMSESKKLLSMFAHTLLYECALFLSNKLFQRLCRLYAGFQTIRISI